MAGLVMGGSIIAANPNMNWPGTAAVVISLVFFRKDCMRNHVHQLESANGIEIQSSQQDGHWHGVVYLNDEPTEMISPLVISARITLKASSANSLK